MTCNTNTKSQSGNMLLALLAGVGAGVVVGLAIAPKSGRKLRADIRSTMDDCLDSASQKAGELRKSGANLAQRGLQDVRKTAGKASEKIQDVVNGTLDGLNGAVDNGAAKSHEVIGRAADSVRTGTLG